MSEATHYDVFLSHNSQDKLLVEQLARRLVNEAKLRPFLDTWNLIPGVAWQTELAEALQASQTAAIFIGPTGNGSWHHEEMQLALNLAVRERNDFRLIPVLLPGAQSETLTGFLQLRTWVDFREGVNNDIAFSRLVAGIQGKATPVDGLTLSDEPAPYRGLMQFTSEHAHIFFGREQDTQRLIDKLRTHRFVATVGSSGCGKSSIVGAGMLPRLAQDDIPGSRHWRTVAFTPADDPWRSLAVALASAQPPEKRGAIVADLRQQFDEPETGLRHTLETWFADASELLLFVDQFEELFTHAPKASTNVGARNAYDERVGRFVRQLAHDVLRSDSRLRVIITLRADFMPHALRIPELKSLLQDRQVLLGELATDEAALREVIQRPAQAVGAMLETGLMELLLADVRRQRGALPLLEHALSELWRERRGPWLTLAAYKKTGGVSGALAQRAEDTLQRLTVPQQHIARRIFVKLTSLEEDTENTRRRIDRKALYAEATDHADIDAVIDVLAGSDARLIVTDTDSLSIAHETLIQNWPTLRTWLQEDRRLERIHRELERAANEWNASGCKTGHLFHADSAKFAETEENALALADRTTEVERKFLAACRDARDAAINRLRRRGQIAAGVAIFVVALIALAVVIWRQQVLATQEKRLALDAVQKQLTMFTGPTGLGADIAIAIGTDDSTNGKVERARAAMSALETNVRPFARNAAIGEKIQSLHQQLTNWERHDVSDRDVQIAILELAREYRSAWDALTQGLSSKMRELIQHDLAAPYYERATQVTKRLARASQSTADRDEFERLYWAELVFFETDEVQSAMVQFRNVLHGDPGSLPALATAVEVACNRALASSTRSDASAPSAR